mgnify:CR=1 FL=1
MPQPVTLPDTIYASGKGAAQESFPVASWLLPPSKRADIMAFYRFARAADDIADHPSLPSDEKLRLLDQMEGRLPPAGAEHTAALLIAFRQDASKARYADRVLDATAALLAASRPLPASIRHRGLRIQAATTQIGAEALLAHLRRQDPLARHVRLGWPMRFWCLLRGMGAGFSAR